VFKRFRDAPPYHHDPSIRSGTPHADINRHRIDGYKKDDLGMALDNYLTENSSRFLANPDLAGYFNSRSKAQGSPVKREMVREEVLKVVRRRPSKAVEEVTPE
jgi:hypothetical protein